MSGMRIHKVDENHADNHQTPIGEWWKPKEKKKEERKNVNYRQCCMSSSAIFTHSFSFFF
jgi:hypothetical protein